MLKFIYSYMIHILMLVALMLTLANCSSDVFYSQESLTGEDALDDGFIDGNDQEPDIDDSTHRDKDSLGICHFPPGNRENAHFIPAASPSFPAHLSHHDDVLGPCPQ